MATQDPKLLNITGSVIRNGEIFSLEIHSDDKYPQIKSTTNGGVETLTRIPNYNFHEAYSATKEYPSISIGEYALASITPTEGGDSDTAYGFEALKSLTTGQNCTGVGYKAGHNYSTGNGNTCIGAYAGGYANTDNQGAFNTFVGSTIAAFATSGGENVGLGMGSLYYLTTGSQNMAIGRASLQELTTGSNNVGVGYRAGRFVTTGSRNTFLGDNLSTGTNVSDTLIVGANARKDVFADANGIVLGDGALGTEVFNLVISNYASLDFADDTAAATGGVALGGVYHTSGALKIRVA